MNKKRLAIVLCLIALVSGMAFAAGTKETAAPQTAPAAQEAPKAEVAPKAQEPKKETTMVYATATFGQKFSPFFATTAYDQDIVSLTQGALLAADRGGAVIYNGIKGETVPYNGTDYTYYGMGDVEVVQNADGSVDYNLTMRDDVKFSDGTPATIDDVIFGIYVMCDPTYDGSSTLYALPIEGMEDYYNSMASASALIYAAGRDNTDFSKWDKATQDAFWYDLDNLAGPRFAQSIADYCLANYASYLSGYGLTVQDVTNDPSKLVYFGMDMWGYGGDYFEGATYADYWKAIVEAYGGDIDTAVSVEVADMDLFQCLNDATNDKYAYGISTGDAVKSISGIKKTGKYSMTVHMTEFDATAIYNMSFYIAPLHYYGDKNLYNGVDSFGFEKGDLSGVKKNTSKPLGCGPYEFVSYANGVVTLKANPYYFLGQPEIDTVLFQESVDSDYVPGTVTGSFDLSTPSISDDVLNAIMDANSNHQLTGDVLSTYLIDYRGYGYIGMNSNLVNVAGNKSSEASKNLRKGIMTILAVYRDTAINSYYGDRAAVIQYPISNTSWAAPQPADAGYQFAYSNDVNGNPIFKDGMTEPERYAAALQASIGFFKAAGYKWDGSKFTAAPAGASLEYEVMIPGDGAQDHPAYGVALQASEALKTVGINLIVNDVTSSTWNNALEANSAQLWAAAWQSTVDPDMYQVYHSSNANGANTNSNHYQIESAELDDLIVAGRKSADTDFRKATYKEAMEIIMDWGVELPCYQRKDCTVASTIRLDNSTLPSDMTPYWGALAEIETLVAK